MGTHLVYITAERRDRLVADGGRLVITGRICARTSMHSGAFTAAVTAPVLGFSHNSLCQLGFETIHIQTAPLSSFGANFTNREGWDTVDCPPSSQTRPRRFSFFAAFCRCQQAQAMESRPTARQSLTSHDGLFWLVLCHLLALGRSDWVPFVVSSGSRRPVLEPKRKVPCGVSH